MIAAIPVPLSGTSPAPIAGAPVSGTVSGELSLRGAGLRKPFVAPAGSWLMQQAMEIAPLTNTQVKLDGVSALTDRFEFTATYTGAAADAKKAVALLRSVEAQAQGWIDQHSPIGPAPDWT